ncbi:3012_t:CDS:2 [Cetraspora pellucida]|uniref:3012_t:CDS:1 n=1 Tax=Cetraspora pellucida TaxID=1433469 RepID=A0A9N9AFI2_9GLOM|nr:3012_t:CDS:2 [Cetraspora pellucida]
MKGYKAWGKNNYDLINQNAGHSKKHPTIIAGFSICKTLFSDIFSC